MKKKQIVGYTQGVYDMFHVGHLRLIARAKEQCDYLIVGVNSDDLTMSYKQKKPVIPENERYEIVNSVKYVDKTIIATHHDKLHAHSKYNFDVIFVGSDHRGEANWTELEEKLAISKAKVVYLPHTSHTSSTLLRAALNQRINAS